MEEVAGPWDIATGIAFGPNAAGDKTRLYVWEKNGKVWIVEDGARLPQPMIDLSDEVGNWRDHGLVGFALDPDFRSNGYIYLLYVVDYYALVSMELPDYNPNANQFFHASIGRLTRYTARVQDDFRSVDPASRTVLIGADKTSGFPILHESHGIGSLVFAKDRSLLVTCGDSASYNGVDLSNNDGGSYGEKGLSEGIITPEQNIGAFRSQSLDSLNGKLLRIDSATGNGLPTNPYYDPAAPDSARSRIWALGLRNPYRFAIKPESGGHETEEGDPGIIMVGDVGWSTWEELNVVTAPGQNFGWPLYEGMDQQPNYWAVKPAEYPTGPISRPVLDWRLTARATQDGADVFSLGDAASPVVGESFPGSSSTGGAWCMEGDYPEYYHGTYFHADYSGRWIKNLVFDDQNHLLEVRPFISNESVAPIQLAVHPDTGELYFASYPDKVFRVVYAPGGNRPPKAVIQADVTSGASPLVVTFNAGESIDPEGEALQYEWDFGDGSAPEISSNPVHVFTGQEGTPMVRTVRLTVTDAGGTTDTAEQLVGVDNTPPSVKITSPAPGTRYPLAQGEIVYPLTADVTDLEQGQETLTYAWQTVLHHNDHTHEEPADPNPETSTVISPAYSQVETYFFVISLTVTDPLGLSTTDSVTLYPDAAGLPVEANDDYASVEIGGVVEVDVLGNDRGAISDADPASLRIVQPPTNGVASTNPAKGTIRYTHNGGPATYDELAYTISTTSGVVSNPGTVRLSLPHGLRGEYFSTVSLETPVLTQVEGPIDFSWRSGAPGPGIPADGFSARWTGFLISPVSGDFQIHTVSDDGVRLWLNDELTVDRWIDQSPTEYSAAISLTEGDPTPIRIEYYESQWDATLRLLWTPPGGSKEVVPAENLLPMTVTSEAPAVQITGPHDGSQYKLWEPVIITAEVSPGNVGEISTLQLLANGEVIGEFEEPPYQLEWDPTKNGQYTLVAKAIRSDGQVGDSSQTPVTVTVGDPNREPVAADDRAEVYPGGEVTINILANDLDPDGELDPASVMVSTGPAYGTTSVDPETGRITYRHGGSAGTMSDQFSYSVADMLGSRGDPARVTISLARTWQGWTAEHSAAGSSLAGNVDGDPWNNLLEFAFGSDPTQGTLGDSGLRLDTSAGTIDAVVKRPAGVAGLTYSLEVSPDLKQWASLENPVVTGLGDGTEELRFKALESSPGLSEARGFCRLRVKLAEPAGEAVSRVLGWYETALKAGQQTLGLSLALPAVWGGTAASISGNQVITGDTLAASSLPADQPCYLEFTSGPAAGHRFDIDPAASSGATLAVNTLAPWNTREALPANAAGAFLVVRPHFTLGGVFPPDKFQGHQQSAQADRVMLFEGGGYVNYFLLKSGDAYHYWVVATDRTGTNQNLRVLAPGQGMFVNLRDHESHLLVTGEVRRTRFPQPLQEGFNLLAEPFPVSQSPQGRHWLASDGFQAGRRAGQAANLHVWGGDLGDEQVGFQIYYLLDAGAPYQYWTSASDLQAPNLNESELLRFDRAAFLKVLTPGGKPDYVLEPPGIE